MARKKNNGIIMLVRKAWKSELCLMLMTFAMLAVLVMGGMGA